MRALNYIAKEFADNWAKPNPLSSEEKDALEHAYITGFEKARTMSAAMVSRFGQLNTATLVQAIANAQVCDHCGSPNCFVGDDECAAVKLTS